MDKELFAKRINALLLIFVLMGGIIGYRLLKKQVFEHGEYLAKAESQYIVKKDIPAKRGVIYSSDMYPLATNMQTFQIIVTPRQVSQKSETASKLANALGMEEKDIFDRINNNKYYIPPLKKKLSEQEGQKIADLKLKGILVMPESIRFYPEKQMASQLLGFVDASGDGRYGFEGYYNDELKGVIGEVHGQKDTRGRIFDIDAKSDPQNGSDFVLTIDRNIQMQVEDVLARAVEGFKADSGSVVINEPKTGKILAMANFPTYDPNEYNKVAKDDQGFFNNATVNDAWEPGSVFKPLIMAAAINENLIEPETEKVFGSSVRVDNYEIRTSTKEAYGRETMTQVLENSDNVAMVWISELLGKEKMYKYLRDFGFGRKSGIELSTESTGTVTDYKKWSESQRATVSFGQGITTTPLQILSAIGAIANKGVLMQPYLVHKKINFDKKEEVRQPKEVARVLTEDTSIKVADMMVSVVENGHGKRAGVKGYRVAGKTGTAQVTAPGGGYYKDRHIGSFVGFAPAENPRFAMLVRLNNPKNVDWAESSAAPTFGEIAKWLLDYFQVAPTEN